NEVAVNVLANDSDPTGQALTITEINGFAVNANDTVTLASGQTVRLNADGTITIDNDALSYGTNSFSYTVSDIDGNTDSAFVTFDATPVCFTPGAMIETTRGPVAIEALEQGDLVITRDNGPKPVRWIGTRTMLAPQKHAPIWFAPGVFGNKSPFSLSPQHRVLVCDYRAQLFFGEDEVLIPAKFLVNGTTITQAPPGEVTYLHLLFDDHEIITADGVASESYHPGQFSLNELEDCAREELFTVFPELRCDPRNYGATARLSLKRHESALLAA
ncbi:MAG: Hint domain-containing protein, partial [Paracoccaceae bacterium]